MRTGPRLKPALPASAAAATDKAQQLGQSTAKLLPDHDGGAVERRLPPLPPSPPPGSDNGARRSRQRRWLHRRMGASAQVPLANDSRKRTGHSRSRRPGGLRRRPEPARRGPTCTGRHALKSASYGTLPVIVLPTTALCGHV
ncbi:unnamed protein product [Ixodes persulcatus]